jgi:hypothetical protein
MEGTVRSQGIEVGGNLVFAKGNGEKRSLLQRLCLREYMGCQDMPD